MAKFTTFCGWEDVPHIDAAAQAEMIASYSPHERDARTKGIPSLGAGAIYPVPESDIICEPFEFPIYFRHVYGLDVGWNRTAAIWAAIDPETDIAYLYSEHYRGHAEPPIHAEAIRGRGIWIPGVIDPAARGRGSGDGEQLFQSYTQLGLLLSAANNAVEDGIYHVWSRLSTGRLKVFKTLQNWLMEYRIYRRDEKGRVVKECDHLMDATRYLVKSGIQIAAQRPLDDLQGRPGWLPSMGPRHRVDFDPFAEAYGGVRKANERRPGWMPGVQR